ncbi:Indigoidine synthase A like protein-domain-containing protein [Mariannaea sp. PMI_226]|nr:Indigoidine synthase A like protein-domain-containing protein [Mariannaea sp. PMI_226]
MPSPQLSSLVARRGSSLFHSSRLVIPSQRRLLTAPASASLAGLQSLLRVSDEVSHAVAFNKPVVALESTIYTHGALGIDLAREHSDLVRNHGAIPAIIAIVDGIPKVGVSTDEIVRMIESGNAAKASRRDIAYLVGMGLAGRKMHGGTTISGTMLLARLAGIRVFGTGGLGGVHRGGENTMDVSADLTELGRTRVAVISSGCKGFLDIPRTLEFLETQGAYVSTFADGRSGKVDFPAFWARDSGTKSPSVVQNEKEAAAIILAQEQLGIESGMLFANPISEEFGIPAAEMQAAIEQAIQEADEKGFTGSANTPFILGRLKELTGGKAVTANKELVTSNLIRASNVAVELSKLLSSSSEPASISHRNTRPVSFNPQPPNLSKEQPDDTPKTISKADILVAGSVAIDLSCDYSAPKSGNMSPATQTSNPACISQSIGGVGHNVALAAHLVSQQARVRLCSMIGDDVAGSTVLNGLRAVGLDTAYIRQLGREYHTANRTAQYVAVNDANKNLVIAMADMGIFSNHSFPEYWKSAVTGTKPKWLVVDGNWSEKDIRAWIKAGQDQSCKVAFEPVSTAKSMNLFCPQKGHSPLRVFPQPTVNIASPNSFELAAMYSAARENGYFDSPEWFDIIDAFDIRAGARDRFVRITSAEMTDSGVPVQSMQLLPYIPTLATKLGPNGVLLTTILGRDDPRLKDRDSDEFIVSRARKDHPTVGGVYMRLFPPAEKVENIVSVNGVGDTFFGVLISGLAQGGKIENLIDVAQKASVLTLKSHQAVSPDLNRLEEELIAATFGRCNKKRATMAPPQDEDMSSSSSSEYEFSDAESEDVKPKQKASIAMYDKDSDEEELERLVLGSKASFRANLFKDNGLFDSSREADGKELDFIEKETAGLEDVDDADLFMFDTGIAAGAPAQLDKSIKTADPNAPVWEDSDDERLAISLSSANRLRKLRITEDEDVVSGAEYSRRLRKQYLQLNPLPTWAREAEDRPSKRRRRSSAATDSSDDDGNDSDSEISAQPLEKLLRDVNRLAGAGTKKRRLRPEVIDIQRTREIPDKHQAPVASLSFHPEYPVLLSASTASILYLHHIAPDAHPTPNPQLTSVQAKQVDVRRAEFLYPQGDKIFFAGRRRFFHNWDLQSGTVQKTSQILGHRLEHKSMERFRLSPCGRYMGIVASTKKGGGIINVLSTTSMQWIAAARLSSNNGIADFAWWSTGDGITILGSDGQVGEYSMQSRSFVGIWRDEGCVGGVVLALGGHQGPSALGDDRWVAIGSTSGITNIYDRNSLLEPKKDEILIKERPTPTRVFEQLVTAITHITFSPDGQLMAFGSMHKKDALRLVHLPSCTLYRNWPTEQTPLGRISAVAFGRQSDLLAVGNDVGKIRLWEIRS